MRREKWFGDEGRESECGMMCDRWKRERRNGGIRLHDEEGADGGGGGGLYMWSVGEDGMLRGGD